MNQKKELHEIYQEVVDLWEGLTEKKFFTNTVSFRFGEGGYNPFRIFIENKNILKIAESYMGGFLSLISLEGMFTEYIKSLEISYYNLIINNVEEATKKINIFKKFHNVLNETEYTELKERFTSKMFDHAVKILKCDETKVTDFLNDLYQVKDVITYFSRVEGKLITNQFVKGAYLEKTPLLNNLIYVFRNVETALNYAKGTSFNFITLVYITDVSPEMDLEFGFFAFVIKNGENIYLVHDRDTPENTAYGINKGWKISCGKGEFETMFPYHTIRSLLTLEQFKQKDDQHALIIIDDEPIHKFTYDQLEVKEALFITLLLDKMNWIYFINDHEEEELSYTMGQIEFTHENKVKTLLPSTLDEIVTIDLPTLEDGPDAKFNVSDQNDFLYKYKDKVKDKEHLLLTVETRKNKLISTVNGVLEISTNELFIPRIFNSDKQPLHVIHNGEFGTKKQLEQRINKFVRKNQATLLNEAFNEDWENGRKAEVIGFITEKLLANKETIFKHIVKGSWIVDHIKGLSFGFEEKAQKNIMHIYDKNNDADVGYYGRYAPFNANQEWGIAVCAVNGGKLLTYKIKIHPTNYKDLCELLNVKRSELPLELQTWVRFGRYIGNSGLQAVDPLSNLSTRVQDIHMLHNAGLTILLSKRGYNKLKKQYEGVK